MSSHLQFLLLGLGTGAAFALLGLGLVVQFRSSGVLNIAHGALAMVVAYAFDGLRSDGELFLPVIGLPHQVPVASGGLPLPLALPIAIAYAALLGLLSYVLIFRHVIHRPGLAKLAASAGLMLALQAVVVLQLGANASGTATRSPAPVLPNEPVELAGATVPRDRLWLCAITLLVAVVLWATYRFTRFGLATRAAADSEQGAAVIGYSATRLGAANCVLGTVVAGLAGILISPVSGLEPTIFTLFVVPALGAALIGRLSSLAVTALAGLVIGMAQSEITKLQLDVEWLPDAGLKEGLPFLVIALVLVLAGRSLPLRDVLHERELPRARRPHHVGRLALLALAAGSVALLVLPSEYRLGLIHSLIGALLVMSVVTVTGYCGQVSLVQMGLAGVGGIFLSILAVDVGIPFPFSLLAAASVAALFGMVVGLTALRTRGMQLAVVTLAAAVALDALFFANDTVSGGIRGRNVPAPELFGVDLGIVPDDPSDFPRPAFGFLVLLVVVGCGVLLANLRTSPTGTHMLAVRARERAAAAAGVEQGRVKLFAFVLASFIAGLAGGLLGMLNGSVSGHQFAVLASILLVATAFNGGVARVGGAVLAGLLFVQGGFGPVGLENIFGLKRYLVLIAGLGLILNSVKFSSGLVGGIDKLAELLARRRPADASPSGRSGNGHRPPIELGEPAELRVEEVSVTFGGVKAIAGASIAVPPGRVVGLIGPNGAGKTSTIDAISGLVACSGGQVLFDGEAISRWSPARRARAGIVRTFQSVELFEDLPVRENVVVAVHPRALRGRLADLVRPHRDDRTAYVDGILDRLGLLGQADALPGALSTGQRMKVGLARALAARPRVLLLDEPAAGLGAAERDELGAALRSLADDGIGLLLVDHDVDLVLSTCDDVYVLDFGMVIAHGAPDEVRRDESVIGAYIGRGSTAATGAVEPAHSEEVPR